MIDHSDARSIHCFGFHLKVLSLIFAIFVRITLILQTTSCYSQPASIQTSKAVAVSNGINLTCPSLIPSFLPLCIPSASLLSPSNSISLLHSGEQLTLLPILACSIRAHSFQGSSSSYSKSPLSSDQQRLVPSATHSSTSTLKWTIRFSYLHHSQLSNLNEHLSHFTFHSISIKPFPSTTTQATLLFTFHSERQQSLLILLSSFIQKHVDTSRLFQLSSSCFHCFKLNIF